MKRKDTQRIGKWSHEHRHDSNYRKKQAEGSRRYQQQLYRDAAFGRIARTWLEQFGDLFKELVAKEKEIDRAVAEAAGIASQKTARNGTGKKGQQAHDSKSGTTSSRQQERDNKLTTARAGQQAHDSKSGAVK